MTSSTTSVDAYLKEVPADRLAALTKIRSLIREICTGYDEAMEYGMPSYSNDGVVEVAFNSQKQNIALYLLKEGVVNKYRDRFPESAVGKGCLRYRNPDKIDFDLMRQMLEDHAASDAKPC